MCKKLPYRNPRWDKCITPIINHINKFTELKTLASCCGHGIYLPVIVVKDKEGNVSEYFSKKKLEEKKRNRYFKSDKNGIYFIPEMVI